MLKTPNCHQGKWILSTTFPLKFTENCLGHAFIAHPINDTYWQTMPREGCSTQPWIYSGSVTWGEEACPACVRREGALTSHLSSCSVWVILVEAFLLFLLFIAPECIKSNMAQGGRVKGMESQVVSREQGTDGSCRLVFFISTGVINKDLAFLTAVPSLIVEHC